MCARNRLPRCAEWRKRWGTWRIAWNRGPPRHPPQKQRIAGLELSFAQMPRGWRVAVYVLGAGVDREHGLPAQDGSSATATAATATVPAATGDGEVSAAADGRNTGSAGGNRPDPGGSRVH